VTKKQTKPLFNIFYTQGMLLKDLQSIGFTKNLAEVYLVLAQLGGQAKAGEIIKKLGIHRNIVYVCLDKLIEKKLITKIEERGITVYKVLDSSRIMNEIHEKEQLAKNIIEEIEAMKQHPDTQEVIVHEGLEGFRNFSLSVLQKMEEGETLQVLGSIGDKWYEFMGEKKYQQYAQLQLKKKIRWQMISYLDSIRDNKFLNEHPDLCKVKLLPQSYNNPANINIFGDTVALQIFTEPFSVIEIKNRSLAEVYRNYFELLWNNNTWTLRGEAGAKVFMEDTLSCGDVYWIGGNGGVEKFYPEIWNDYKIKRIDKKVFWHDLITPGMALSSTKTGNMIYDEPYYEYKFLPATVTGPHVICLYGNKMASIVWKEDTVINIIEDQEVVETYKKYFHYLWNQNTKTYKGWEEVEKLFFEELLPNQNAGDQLYCIGGGYGATGEDQQVEDFFVRYNTARIKNGAKLSVLFYEQHRDRARKEFIDSGDADFSLTTIKFLPAAYYSPLQIQLMNGKTIIITWGTEPSAIVYEDKDVYDSFKKQFDLFWNQEVFTYRGWEEIDQIFRSNLEEGYTHDVYNANYGVGSEEESDRALDFYIEYHKKTAYLKPKKRLIFFEQDRAQANKEVSPLDTMTRENINLKFLPDKYFSPTETHVFNDKVILLFSFGEPIATVYTNPKIIEVYKKQFELWWDTATE